jgi:iron complex outermembrane recepter protein
MKYYVLLFMVLLTPIILLSQTESDSVKVQFPPVTITATRFVETWLEIPLAINVLQKTDLQASKNCGVDEILAGVPGVLAQSRYGNQDVRLTIRGFGARGAGARSNAGTTRGIRVLIDGFPETEPDGRTSFDLLDLSGAGRIEIVRSNASSIWGNAAGGVMNVISNTTFESPYVNLQSSFGSFGFQKNSAQLGTTLGTGKFFFSFNNTKSDGWRNHSGSSQTLFNTGVVSPLGEKTSLGIYLSATTNIFRIPGPLSQAQFDSLAEQSDATYIKRDERRFNRLGRLGITLTHDLDEGNSITSSVFINPKYLQRSERGTFRDFNRYHVGGNLLFENRSQVSSTVKNIFLAGMDEAYQDGAILFYGLTPSGDRDSTISQNKREGANNFGGFISDEIVLEGGWSFLLGARYDNISYFYDNFIEPAKNDSKSFARVTPKLGVTYKLSESHSVYANLGGGVEVPAGNETNPVTTSGFNQITDLNPLLEPIISTTYEIGTKGITNLNKEQQDGLLTYDLALYLIDVKNDIIPYSGGQFFFTAGKTRRMGVEFGGRMQFKNGISGGIAITGSSNKFIDYVIDSVHYGASGRFVDLKDNKVPGLPDLFYNIDVRYAPEVLKGFFVKANLHGIGSYFADDRNKYDVPSATVVDGMIGFERVALGTSPVSISGFFGVNNLFDKKYAASVWINPDLVKGKPVFLEPGLPRNVVGSFGLNWNF